MIVGILAVGMLGVLVPVVGAVPLETPRRDEYHEVWCDTDATDGNDPLSRDHLAKVVDANALDPGQKEIATMQTNLRTFSIFGWVCGV